MDVVACLNTSLHSYLNEDQLFVFLQVQGRINIRGDSFQLFGVAVVQNKTGVPPHFIACNQQQHKPLNREVTAAERSITEVETDSTKKTF